MLSRQEVRSHLGTYVVPEPTQAMTMVNYGHTKTAKAACALSIPIIPFQPVMMTGLHGLATEVS